MDSLRNLVDEVWYGKHPLSTLLLPLAWIFHGISWARRAIYSSHLLNVYRAPVPVIVIGNLSVGGTGKTPLSIWLARKLRDWGFKPGVIARGYRGQATHWPQQVRADSDPFAVGDEAIIIARQTGLPVAVGPRRGEDIEALIKHSQVNIIISDDGLQHYALARDVEIIVIDGIRRLGNGRCLPAGPLRESQTRVTEADLVVSNGLAARGEFPMRYRAGFMRRVDGGGEDVSFEAFEQKSVHAVAGLGNPQSFFASLKRNGFRCQHHAFPDHHVYSPGELDFGDRLPIVMTEKDAVKCEHFADERFWYVPIEVDLPEVFERRLKTILKRVLHGQEAA